MVLAYRASVPRTIFSHIGIGCIAADTTNSEFHTHIIYCDVLVIFLSVHYRMRMFKTRLPILDHFEVTELGL